MRYRAILVAALGLTAALARPASACCQLGGSGCGDPFAVDCNNGVVCFFPYRTCPACTCTATNGGHACLPTASEPGIVFTLQMNKSSSTPGDVDLTWSASCNPSSPEYSIHEGTIGTWYSHEGRKCATFGALAASLTPFGGNRYYLVAPIAGDFTGSLGTSSAGVERPDGSPSCTSDRALAPCP